MMHTKVFTKHILTLHLGTYKISKIKISRKSLQLLLYFQFQL